MLPEEATGGGDSVPKGGGESQGFTHRANVGSVSAGEKPAENAVELTLSMRVPDIGEMGD
ncbi:hypothetical protein Afil01_20990 [Actinorhabdospora filicis]|uniref:Uncharacterized protein n=1 Tax=Actinorhabdospora filicis TaxID=1785913 RepID=A0A9W6SJW1_9ACTN|nr:hypothetical protein Afil01_20990 [Actinorhabdospora filicis]